MFKGKLKRKLNATEIHKIGTKQWRCLVLRRTSFVAQQGNLCKLKLLSSTVSCRTVWNNKTWVVLLKITRALLAFTGWLSHWSDWAAVWMTEVRFPAEMEIYLVTASIPFFIAASRTALGPTRPPIQWVPRAHSLVVKRPGREADHSPPSSAEFKECVELYLHSPIRLHGVVLS
jgi:hypothetical protein